MVSAKPIWLIRRVLWREHTMIMTNIVTTLLAREATSEQARRRRSTSCNGHGIHYTQEGCNIDGVIMACFVFMYSPKTEQLMHICHGQASGRYSHVVPANDANAVQHVCSYSAIPLSEVHMYRRRCRGRAGRSCICVQRASELAYAPQMQSSCEGVAE